MSNFKLNLNPTKITEVFITNIRDNIHVGQTIKILKDNFPELKINFDLEKDSASSFPCNHSILRVEGVTIDTEKIILVINKSGFLCDILEDKICK